MLNPIVSKFQYGKHTVTLETGMIGRQATSSVIVTMDETAVFVTLVKQKKARTGFQDFLPLTVNYQERSYAAGKIPGNFFRREGRPSENETLISRLIDRPIRPLFSDVCKDEIQITATLVSLNPEVNPDIVAIIGVSVVLSLSNVPFNGPIGAARVGYINNEYILNPNAKDLKSSQLDLVVSGTDSAVIMVESEAKMLSEEKILQAIIFGHQKQKVIIDHIKLLKTESTKTSDLSTSKVNTDSESLYKKLLLLSQNVLKEVYSNYFDKEVRCKKIEAIRVKVIKQMKQDNELLDEDELAYLLGSIEKEIIRNRILLKKPRVDGREQNMIRGLDIRTGVLPRTHGSSLFTRGDTQALVTVTLGVSRDAQVIDELVGERTDNFLFHYNFPPYAVGEIGSLGAPKRREIGHGRLAKRALLAVMPTVEEFPYTTRIVSEITESNGSSSMASVCGASLALMDAGVPIKSAVAGVAMGLVKKGKQFVILSDILGEEDHLGDMDFKVAGSTEGISSLQMDIKIQGITEEIMRIALKKAKDARLHILNVMNQAISNPRNEVSPFAPKFRTIRIKPEKIKDVIGRGGSVIRALTEETGTSIEVEDNGNVKISASDHKKVKIAVNRLQEITAEIEIGKIYNGKVTRIVDFGAFIGLNSNKEGLIHISQISDVRVEKISDHLKVGQVVSVRVVEIDRYKRIRLSMKNIKCYQNKELKKN